jgi:rfaE bifunctional protein kinase chain/domain
MKESNLSTEGILSTNKRKTTIKTRVIAENKHQLRIDEEETSPIEQVEEFLKLTISLINDIDVIILQDYNKGVLTSEIIEKVIGSANKKGIPTIVDPKKLNFNSYKNCTIFKPNLAEIKTGMKVDFDANNIAEIEKTTSELRKKLSAKGVLLTLSEKGICINSEKEFKYTPAFKRNIIDVSGAGDTVISVASLCLASKMDYTDLSVLSSLAGGLVCEKVGVMPINKEKLLEQALKHIS